MTIYNKQADANPYKTIKQIFESAEATISTNPLAMILATADKAGHPSSRTVLLKHYDENGFVFFTNSHSRKGTQINENPFVSVTFYLPQLKTQIQIEGTAAYIPTAESDAYFSTRLRESQLGAWASAQSQEIIHDNDFTARYQQFETRFEANKTIPRPSHWNGYRISPHRIEIWYEGAHRLHTRYCYTQQDGQWDCRKLFP